jgi:hypothetical protein
MLKRQKINLNSINSCGDTAGKINSSGRILLRGHKISTYFRSGQKFPKNLVFLQVEKQY